MRATHRAGLLLAIIAVVAQVPVLAAGGEPVDGSRLLKPEWGTIFWTVVTFIALLFLLSRFAWKPLIGAIDERERGIQATLDEAKAERDEAATLLEQHKALVADSRRERATAIEQGKRDAERVREEMLEAARSERDRLMQQTQEQIDSGIRKARDDLRGTAVDLAIKAAEKLLARNLDEPTQRRLVEEHLADLERSGGGPRPELTTVDIDFGPGRGRSPVHVGAGVRGDCIAECAARSADGVVVLVSDGRVARLHGESFADELQRSGLTVHRLTFPAGEASKTRQTKALLEDRLSALKVGRRCTVVALGGGVTGDLAGFVAATWHRGVDLVQVPTTLLAMVDASIGGKTGVNVPDTKNAVGAIHPPRSVWIDPDFLGTLDDVDYRDGFAEVVKAGVIGDAALFERLEGGVERLLRRDAVTLVDTIVSSVRVKAGVVSRDAVEHGERAVLNFGHTVAHALEAVSGFSESHGRAVSAGMCAEARLARETTGFPAADVERLEALLSRFGLPIRVGAGYDREMLLAAAGRDKKSLDGAIRCALPLRIGTMADRGSGCRVVDVETLARAIDDVRAADAD